MSRAGHSSSVLSIHPDWIKVLRARCSLWECFAPCFGSLRSARPCPAMPASGIFSHCYHFSPLSGSDISFRSPSLFSLTPFWPAVGCFCCFLLCIRFSFHRLIFCLCVLWSFMFSFLCWLLSLRRLSEWPSAPWLGPVNQTVIELAGRFSLPLLCCWSGGQQRDHCPLWDSNKGLKALSRNRNMCSSLMYGQKCALRQKGFSAKM